MKGTVRLVSLFMAVLLLLLCTACAKKTDTSTANEMCYGDPDAKDFLRILVDVGYGRDEVERLDLHNFAFSLQESGGLENFVIEIIPESGVERETAISRLRTEIMSGAGPDVFILASGDLIPYPEEAMENGLFLPLDTYMENNSRFTNWDDQQQTVLAAGRNEEGQQIIPLSYTFPVTVYPQTALDVDKPDTLLTWNDTLTDPEWKDIYASINDLRREVFFEDVDGSMKWTVASELKLEYAVGRIADYKEEELLVTEKELLQRIKEILALREESPITHELGTAPYREYYMSENVSSKQYNVPITILPMYSDDGGVTVTVNNFAAVNRNTRQPDKAYTVIDILMRESTQLDTNFYANAICYGFIPLNNNAFHPDHPLHLYYLDEASFDELTDIKEQITAVNFKTELSLDINRLLYECEEAQQSNQPIDEIVHEAYVQIQRKLRE